MLIRRTLYFLFVVLCLIANTPIFSQKYMYPYGVESPGVAGAVDVTSLARQAPQNRSPEDVKSVLRVYNGTNVTKLVFFVSGYTAYMKALNQARNDIQTGSSPNSSGTTSIVSKGVAAQVLSLAVENGALARTDTQTVSTFRADPTGVARLLKGDDVFPYCAIYDAACVSPLARLLEGASASVSFNTTPPATSAPSNGATANTNNSQVLSVSSQQVAGWGARYDFHVRKAPADIAKDYGTQFNDTVRNMGLAYTQSVQLLLQKISPADLAAWEGKYVSLLRSDETADQAGFTKALALAVSDLATLAEKSDPTFKSASDVVVTKMSSYFVNRDRLLSDYVNKITFSVSYDDTYPANQPNQSSLKFILSARPAVSQITANATVEWYDHTLQSSVNRLRDAQVAFESDQALGKASAPVIPNLSIGYYFQYMIDNALISLPSTALAPGTAIPLPGNASELLKTKGAIHLGQAKITFKIKSSGLSIPLALTFSNRTDLIKASNVRGNFGITYDLSNVFAKQ